MSDLAGQRLVHARSGQFPRGAQTTRDELSNQLHETLHRLRETEPVSWVQALGGWLVTSYSTAVEILRDAGRFTVEDDRFTTGRVVGPSMLSTDGARHQHNRQPFEPMFRSRPVSNAASALETATDQLIGKFAADKKAELRTQYAGPLAVKVISDFLGLTDRSENPGTEIEVQLLARYRTIVAAVSALSDESDVPTEALQAVNELNQLIIENTRPTGFDNRSPLGNLLAADNPPDKDILSNTAVILFGAIETCEGMTANALFHLLTHRAQNNAGAPPTEQFCRLVVAESLRLEPAASVVDRYATADVQVDGAAIHQGDLVVVSLAGANRDPTVFSNPDAFDPKRPNAARHLAFARGPHTCLGIHLAKLQTSTALQRLFSHLPHIALDVPSSTAPSGSIFRKSDRVSITW